MDIKNFVGLTTDGLHNKVHFQYYRQGYFHYSVDSIHGHETFVFPIPSDDVGTATLCYSDKAITFMRWIRKAIDNGTLIKK